MSQVFNYDPVYEILTELCAVCTIEPDEMMQELIKKQNAYMETLSEPTLPFGKYAGRTVKDVHSLRGGHNYLIWLKKALEEPSDFDNEILLQAISDILNPIKATPVVKSLPYNPTPGYCC